MLAIFQCNWFYYNLDDFQHFFNLTTQIIFDLHSNIININIYISILDLTIIVIMHLQNYYRQNVFKYYNRVTKVVVALCNFIPFSFKVSFIMVVQFTTQQVTFFVVDFLIYCVHQHRSLNNKYIVQF